MYQLTYRVPARQTPEVTLETATGYPLSRGRATPGVHQRQTKTVDHQVSRQAATG
jgi:hypothetical protein